MRVQTASQLNDSSFFCATQGTFHVTKRRTIVVSFCAALGIDKKSESVPCGSKAWTGAVVAEAIRERL